MNNKIPQEDKRSINDFDINLDLKDMLMYAINFAAQFNDSELLSFAQKELHKGYEDSSDIPDFRKNVEFYLGVGSGIPDEYFKAVDPCSETKTDVLKCIHSICEHGRHFAYNNSTKKMIFLEYFTPEDEQCVMQQIGEIYGYKPGRYIAFEEFERMQDALRSELIIHIGRVARENNVIVKTETKINNEGNTVVNQYVQAEIIK